MGFRQVIVAALALALVVAGLSGWLVYTQVTSLSLARGWVDHTRTVIETTERLVASVQDAQSGERGYLITHDTRYLAPFQRAEAMIPAEEAQLRDLVGDNPAQSQEVRALIAAIDQRRSVIRGVVDTARKGDFGAARDQVVTGLGLSAMADIETRADRIIVLEKKLLDQRRGQARGAQSLALTIGLAVSLVALMGLTAGTIVLAASNRRLSRAIDKTGKAEAELASAESLTRAIFENSPDYLIVLGVEPNERFVLADINPAFERALRVKAEQVRGRALSELLPGPIGVQLTNHFRRVCAANRPVTTRDEVPRLPGGPRVWESVYAPVHNASGVTDRVIGAIRDITDRVRSDERLRDAQRMEAIGQLTGGVAHDFNNLLQVIRGNLELLERYVVTDDRASARLRNAIHGTERAAQLTRQLLAFARRQPLAPQVINLSRLVSDMADLLRRTLGEAIEVETVVAGGLWNTVADPAQVESALLNLALNARDAMPAGGRLTIEITNAVLDDAYARAAGDVAPGQYVMIAVSDTGEGMPDAVRTRVFEPFFTTKTDGKGTGLGLSMVYGFVKQSGGHVQIYSEVGQGTTVKIYLPRSMRAIAAVPAHPEPAAPGESRIVLVVEDEEAVREAAIAVLEELGYHHLAASDAASALALIESGAKVDLVFTDVVMPGPLQTRDFARKLQDLRPELPILFTSGYTDNAIIHHGRLDERVSLISKPYAKSDLARRISQLLNGEAATV